VAMYARLTDQKKTIERWKPSDYHFCDKGLRRKRGNRTYGSITDAVRLPVTH